MRKIETYGEDYTALFFERVGTDLKKAGFDYFRVVRGDGNCYYRSVAVAWVTEMAVERNEQALLAMATMIYS